jgi:hypothetical protein
MIVIPAPARRSFIKIVGGLSTVDGEPRRRSRLIRIAVAAATAIVATLATSTPALAADGDTTPPTTPFLAYAQGYYCGVLIVGMDRSTDDVTPQSQLKYEVFVDGAPFGPAIDQGSESGVWAWFQAPGPVLPPGPHTVTAEAQDAAGNWSAPSRALPVTGYPC